MGGGSSVSGPKNVLSELVVTGVLRESSKVSEAWRPALSRALVSKQKLLTSASATCVRVSRPSIIITELLSFTANKLIICPRSGRVSTCDHAWELVSLLLCNALLTHGFNETGWIYEWNRPFYTGVINELGRHCYTHIRNVLIYATMTTANHWTVCLTSTKYVTASSWPLRSIRFCSKVGHNS